MAVLFALLRARVQKRDLLPMLDINAMVYRASFEYLRGDPDFEAWGAGIEAQRKERRP